jgi:hypothetical protein
MSGGIALGCTSAFKDYTRMKYLAAFVLSVLLPSLAHAELPSGVRRIVLKSATEAIEIGTVTFDGAGSTRQIKVSMHDPLYKDEFLSMRPFKCLESAVRYYCHLPYPYAWKGEITEADLTDLEYALLFVQKVPTAYGINLWDGIYYKLSLAADGKITGALHDIDMDNLASPPKDGSLRPITTDMINAAAANGQWLPTLSIE